MMILLGLGDILATLVLILRVSKTEVAWPIIVFFGVYLIAKTLIFEINIAGLMDFVGGIMILLSFFINLPKVFSIIVILLLVFKAVRSL
jgi:hypothetical protein